MNCVDLTCRSKTGGPNFVQILLPAFNQIQADGASSPPVPTPSPVDAGQPASGINAELYERRREAIHALTFLWRPRYKATVERPFRTFTSSVLGRPLKNDHRARSNVSHVTAFPLTPSTGGFRDLLFEQERALTPVVKDSSQTHRRSAKMRHPIGTPAKLGLRLWSPRKLPAGLGNRCGPRRRTP